MAKVLPIYIYPAPVLDQPAKEVSLEDIKKPQFQRLILDMVATMIKKDGIGLAATQVGQNLRLCVINTQDGNLILINPKIIKYSWKKQVSEEGCLSVPGVFGLVKRAWRIQIAALDSKGRKLNFKAEGLFARVVQHELDHLAGILFIKKAKKITQGRDTLTEYERKST